MRAYERARQAIAGSTIITETESLRYLRKTEEEESAPCSRVDGIISTVGVNQDAGVYMLTAVLECRARWFSEDKLETVYDSHLIFDKSKLEAGHAVARSLNTEFWMLQVIVHSRCYYVGKLTDKAGNYLSDNWYEQKTNTRKTVNTNEKSIRDHIYFDITKAHRYDIE
jgi:hypothetical protein